MSTDGRRERRGRWPGSRALATATASIQRSWPYRFGIFYWFEAQGPERAAAIAYRLLLYLFPLFGALVTILAVVLRDPERLSQAIGLLLDIFPAQWRGTLGGLLALQERALSIGLVSLLTLLWFSSSLLTSIVQAFDRQYGVPPRPIMQQWLVGLLAVALLALALVAAVVALGLLAVAAVAAEARLAQAGFPLVPPAQAAARAGSFALAFPLLLTFYWRTPNVVLPLGQVWPGAAVGAGLLIAAIQLFPLYLSLRPESDFGALLGFVFLLTTWLYLLSHILLIGNAFNAYRWRERHPAGAPP